MDEFAMPNEGRWEYIYHQINGMNESDVCEWARDESSMEGMLGPFIEQAYGARNRICERLGTDPESDPDMELLVSGFERFARACGKLMYYYGYLDWVHET